DMVRGEVTLTKTKTGRPRTVTLSAQAAGTLAGTPRHIVSPYVFWHGAGDRYHEFASRFLAICKAAGQDFRCHDLRHKFAIDWLRAGGDIYRLSRHLGHSSAKTTEIYLGHVGEGRHESRHSDSGSAQVAGGENGP
ncbi:MAG: tyrosine-type recombinase/integrase, partial [Alphaproteobacteria bacterium]